MESKVNSEADVEESTSTVVGSELILGLVSPVGVNKDGLLRELREYCRAMGYVLVHHKLSALIEGFLEVDTVESEPYLDRISRLMGAGNDLREIDSTAVAMLATQGVRNERDHLGSRSGVIHLLDSIKHPDEVDYLRSVYRRSFFLISLHSSKGERIRTLKQKCSLLDSEAQKLVEKDAKEGEAFQQRTRDAFELGDVFLSAVGISGQLRRFLNLVYAHPFLTPTRDEYGMFLAHSASLRSASLARQVGAAILTDDGDLISTGCNDVPKAMGGQYWPGPKDNRDFVRALDSNDAQKDIIVAGVVEALTPNIPVAERVSYGRSKLRSSGLLDLTEFGRDVHAEMEALMSALRMGKSAVGATLFTTTFPCHNCAKHVLSAGIRRVVFVEPYPKSKADQLHHDAIAIEPSSAPEGKVPFEAFIGVGPRRFFDLFSLGLSSGARVVRKDSVTGVALEPMEVMRLRSPEPSYSLGDLEAMAADLLQGIAKSQSKTGESDG